MPGSTIFQTYYRAPLYPGAQFSLLLPLPDFKWCWENSTLDLPFPSQGSKGSSTLPSSLSLPGPGVPAQRPTSTPDLNVQRPTSGPQRPKPRSPHAVPFAPCHAPGNPDLVRGKRAADPDPSLKAGRGGVHWCPAASPPRRALCVHPTSNG